MNMHEFIKYVWNLMIMYLMNMHDFINTQELMNMDEIWWICMIHKCEYAYAWIHKYAWKLMNMHEWTGINEYAWIHKYAWKLMNMHEMNRN